MAAYTFYLQDRSGAVPTFEIEMLEGDEHARAHAKRLLHHRPRYDGIEVVSGERQVCELRRSPRGAGAASFDTNA